jgi:hypothetical protein
MRRTPLHDCKEQTKDSCAPHVRCCAVFSCRFARLLPQLPVALLRGEQQAQASCLPRSGPAGRERRASRSTGREETRQRHACGRSISNAP